MQYRVSGLNHIKSVTSCFHTLFQMDDHDGERREPFQSRAKSSHHGRSGVGTKIDSEKPRTVSESHGQPSRKGSISPPPLKRQRTTYENFSSETRGPRSTNRQAHLPTSSAALRHSFGGHTQTASAAPTAESLHLLLVLIRNTGDAPCV
ncbi:hypothetical protein ACET3X_003861 [Alternaria dauci]|uniref:Uncharacterized protein n=1 Tax=Alternaria dauci TaxID=48095 RepID=A0ABR3UMI7_9PLEO